MERNRAEDLARPRKSIPYVPINNRNMQLEDRHPEILGVN